MNLDPAITDEVRLLVADVIERRLNDAGKARLGQLLTASEPVRSFYVQMLQQHASLHWYLKAASQEETKAEDKADRIGALAALAKIAEYERNQPLKLSPAEAESHHGQGRAGRRSRSWMLAAVSLLLAAMLGLVFVVLSHSPKQAEPTAAITRTHNALWKNASGQLETKVAGTRLIPGEMELSRGEAELTFDDGAIVVVDAYDHAARFRIDSGSALSLHQGRVTTYMKPESTGVFTIRTPALRVTQKQAAFGLNIRPSGAGELHVFRGRVSAFQIASTDEAQATTVVAGNQALRFEADGRTIETMQAEAEPFAGELRKDERLALLPPVSPVEPAPRAPSGPLLTAVTATSGSRCSVGRNLADGDLAYVDRFHVWRQIPDELRGLDYARLTNSDKSVAGNRISVTVSRPAVIYVLWNSNTDPQPWLREKLRDTGRTIGMDRIDQEGTEPVLFLRYQIWRREIPAGTFELGPFEVIKEGLPGIAVVDTAEAGL